MMKGPFREKETESLEKKIRELNIRSQEVRNRLIQTTEKIKPFENEVMLKLKESDHS